MTVEVIETPLERRRRQALESYHRTKNNGWVRAQMQCAHCEADFMPKTSRSRYCSKNCSQNGHYRENPLAHRREYIKRNYGVTVEQVQKQTEHQGNLCAICGERGSRPFLSIDHCHETEQVRGLLCNDCNLAIGMMKDDVERLRAAADYLQGGGVWVG